MIKFPENLIFARDQIIDHVQSKCPAPECLDQLVKWIETEYLYDSLMETWDDERVAMQIGGLSEYRFCDSELIAYSDMVEPITDQARVLYARELISKAFHELDGYDCPSIHTIQISKDDQISATLCWTVVIQGQAGPVPTFYGAFSSRENFYQDLRDSGYLLNGEEESLTDEVILSLWFKPFDLSRPVIVTVTSSDVEYQCPMSEQTWKRIMKGKLVRRVETYQIDGMKTKSEWLFNSQNLGSLIFKHNDELYEFNLEQEGVELNYHGHEFFWADEIFKE